ncbi:MAG: RNA polymerase sigma factor [Eubacteriales bacterium]|nr:RNA polymerase sigma factor [Eubacteriales bacterium]
MEEIRNRELISRIAKGEEEALAILYKEISKDVFVFALSVLENYHDAEDVMQEVFLKIKLHARTCKSFKNINGWIIRITKNTAIDYIRKRKKDIIDEDLAKDTVDMKNANTGTIAEQSIFITEIFDELKGEERQILILRLVSDLTHRSIAEALDLPLATVKWRYRKAISCLEELSNKKGWEL